MVVFFFWLTQIFNRIVVLGLCCVRTKVWFPAPCGDLPICKYFQESNTFSLPRPLHTCDAPTYMKASHSFRKFLFCGQMQRGDLQLDEY